MSLQRNFFAGLATLSDTREPLLWLDARLGLSADMSTWRARVGNYTAVQPDSAKRYTKVADSRPNWLRTTSATHMTVPQLDLHGTEGITVIAAVSFDDPAQPIGQEVAIYPDGNFYAFNGFVEFFVTESPTSPNVGNNPTAPIAAGEFVVTGGWASTSMYPSSRAFVRDYVGTGYNRIYGRHGAFQTGDWLIGHHTGRLRHLLVFDHVLSDTRRAYWVARLSNSTP